MHKQLLDANFSIITSLIKEKSRVLDLGCGKGKLLKHLKLEKSCEVQGIDVSQQEVIDCIANAVPVLQLDLEEGMSFFQDKSFDFVVISQTMQQVHNPDKLIREALRVGKKVIVSVHNLAYWKSRLQITLKGMMPNTKHLPYEWYNTPNIHLGSIRDFYSMCEKESFRITHVYPGGDHFLKSFNKNLFSEFSVFTLESH
ncbi:methionine biosynthesis protein [Lentisphaera araneosa HTCC2155]|uniref:Methionine biosynthesis protein n=1 Tax=Lentisphaera araneosa HTCC2155 TaxID=313628 RepID=A6DP86_9BACT|nr:methionine biosynthesis protein MetW [Lentisphaera araneosa]EDM26618.1 methionine biosynthesis protein [Lentisphaera araneosa HTCC2155]